MAVALMGYNVTWICEKSAAELPIPPTFFSRFLAELDNFESFSPDTCRILFFVELGHVSNIKIQQSQVSRANKRSTLLENNKFVLNDSNLCNLARKSKTIGGIYRFWRQRRFYRHSILYHKRATDMPKF